MELDFSEWLKLSESHLYHGTTVDNEESIRKYGLQPGVGRFVQVAYNYDDVEHPKLVFAADKKSLDKALTAMIYHIGEKLGKGMHNVTNNDIRNYGLLVIADEASDDVDRRGEDDYDEKHPYTVEPGDYYSDGPLHGTRFVKGPSLIRLLNRFGVLPREWGPDDPKQDNLMRGRLGAWAAAKDRETGGSEYLQRVLKAPQRDVERWYLQNRER